MGRESPMRAFLRTKIFLEEEKMKAVETRKIDNLGRIVLPLDVRNELGVTENDELDICVNDGKIILKKLQEFCVICKNTDSLMLVNSKFICTDCVAKVKVLP